MSFNFKASNSWLFRLKQKFKIVSRKVTKIVSTDYSTDYLNILKNANDFLLKAKDEIKKFPLDCVINTDQMGINYEIASSRTLSNQGEKQIICAVNSINATTHSYTIQPLISMQG